ncbi:MAG: SWIM zinc finger family protein [Methanosarcinales archaeon]
MKRNGEWRCSCPDHKYRKVVCKHIYAVGFWLALKQKLEKRENRGSSACCLQVLRLS